MKLSTIDLLGITRRSDTELISTVQRFEEKWERKVSAAEQGHASF